MMPPLVVAFAAGSVLHREADRPSDLPIVRNGPPGTFVMLDGVRISLPTDQIVGAFDAGGAVTVAFGGMRFTGVAGRRLAFRRIRDLLPEEQLSPDRSWTMTLEPHWVATVHDGGRQVWPGADDAVAGLCGSCVHARAVASSKGATFLLCQRSSTDPSFRRYPTLPVLACPGYAAGRG
jgi:hypothetical protein